MFERIGERVNVPGTEAEREGVLREGAKGNEGLTRGVFFLDGRTPTCATPAQMIVTR